MCIRDRRMHLDRRLGCAERRPRKQRQGQVDGCRVQRIRRVLQLEGQAVADIELSGLGNQSLGELGMNTPVPLLVGIGKCCPSDLLPEPHVIKLRRLCRETDLEVAQTLAAGQLRNCLLYTSSPCWGLRRK